ncbi:MAG: dTDP-4-dehydrorhamnose reductase [Salinibacter sp.]
MPTRAPLSPDALFGPTVLVTGANGLLGQALTQRLAEAETITVHATARDETLRAPADCAYHPMDVTAPDEVEATFKRVEPDVVVNCAALSDVSTCDQDRNRAWATNARAVKRLARHCKDTRAHLVQVSTDFVFNGKRGPYDEAARPDPVNYYGRTKLAGENHVRDAGRTRWTIARTILLYGTGVDLSRQNIVLWMIDQLRQGEPIHVVTDQWRTPTYVPDLAEGLYQIVRQKASGIYHLSGPDLVSIHELALAVAEVFDLNDDLIHPVPSDHFADAVERPSKTGFAIEKAQQELAYAPHSLRDGLRALRAERR